MSKPQIISDKNKKFKNIRSTILLEKVIKMIKLKGYLINNIDINIISQTPKIKKYKNKMIENISKIFNLFICTPFVISFYKCI